jgi:hypothetical protein
VFVIPVDLQAEKLPDGSPSWSVLWHDPPDAAIRCRAQQKDANDGYGTIYVVHINGAVANIKNKDHKKIVKSIKDNVARCLSFLHDHSEALPNA